MADCNVLNSLISEICTLSDVDANFSVLAEFLASLCCENDLDVNAYSSTRVNEGETAEFFAQGGVSWSWTGPNGFTSDLQGPTIDDVTSDNAGLYKVEITTSTGDGCEEPITRYAFLFVAPCSFDGEITGPNIADIGDTIELTIQVDDAVTPDSYNWTGPNGFAAAGQTQNILLDELADAGTFQVEVVVGGCSRIFYHTVTILECSNEDVYAAANTPVCLDDTIELFASGGASYSWTGPDSFASALQNPTITNAAAINAGNYTVVITKANGCTETILVPVQVINCCEFTHDAYTKAVVCDGDTIELFASGGDSYAWTGPGGFTSAMQNPTNAASSTSQGNYIVTITKDGCPDVIKTLPVVVQECPPPAVTLDVVCE